MEVKIRFFNPALTYQKNKYAFDAAMQDVLARGDLILRKDVEEFEEAFAEFVGTKYAVGVASGTDALILSLAAFDIGPGDEVLAPSYTFRATVEAALHRGATVRLYDIDGKIEFTANTRAFIPAYIAGEIPAYRDEAVKRAKDAGIVVIEDTCQAVGAGPVLGHTAAYSFYPAKILGCFGDGGAIATNDPELYERLKIMRNHFKGDWGPAGYNSRLDNLQAAILKVQLSMLAENIKARKLVAMRYNAELQGPFKKPAVREVYQDYIIEFETQVARDNTHDQLAELGVETLKNEYPFPKATPKLPGAVAYESRSLRIPCNPNLTDEEMGYIINSINGLFKK